MSQVTALAINCTLRRTSSDEPSSTDKLIAELFAAMGRENVKATVVRAADYDIRPGVTSDEGDGDEWPELRKQVLAADILVLGTPIWMGQPSSIAKRVLERMDAFLYETDDQQRMPASGKVAVVLVVGNEDGAHHCHAECYQALADVGFTIPANGGAYWVGEAMQSVNYIDIKETPPKVRETLAMLASNALHLARLLKSRPYPGLAD